jgi:hypothetical protein
MPQPDAATLKRGQMSSNPRKHLLSRSQHVTVSERDSIIPNPGGSVLVLWPQARQPYPSDPKQGLACRGLSDVLHHIWEGPRALLTVSGKYADLIRPPTRQNSNQQENWLSLGMQVTLLGSRKKTSNTQT